MAQACEYIWRGVKTVYYTEGSGYPVLLLHGWGCDHSTMNAVYEHLIDRFKVYSFDMPGHGASDEPNEPWGTEVYTELLLDFMREEGIEKPIIIAHSFGGRLALRLGAAGIPHKMILTGCAGLKPHRGVDYYAKVYSYKAAKKLAGLAGKKKQAEIVAAMQAKRGSSDYQAASPNLRQTFVKVVNEDLSDMLPKITAPTVLYWGENDTATPITDGQKMAKEMRDAGLITVPGGDHYAFLYNMGQFLAVIDSFIGPEANKN